MRILITGGAGFIGSNFIRLVLRSQNNSVVNFDKLTYAGNPHSLKDLEGNERYSFVKGDICDPVAVEAAMKGADAVVHFAAESHVDRSIAGAADFIKTNVEGTYVMLEAARKLGIKRFVHIDTDEVYGSVLEGSSKETDALDPRNPYSASKAAAGLLARSYSITYGLPVMITRSSNNFGPYQHREKLIPRFITNTLNDKKLPLYGTGKNVRDWIFVEDNCRGIETILMKGKPGEIYNIGGGNEKTNLEITRTILEVLGKPESLIEFVKDRPGHDMRYSLDITKIRELGWKPQRDFKEAMKETIQWYKDNEWWWKGLSEFKTS